MNKSTILQVPPAVQSECPVAKAGETGWVFDPFSKSLLPEFFDCTKGPNAAIWRLPFEVGGVAMHFDKTWYRENNAKTLACMRDAISNKQVARDTIAAWASLTGAELRSAVEIVGNCVQNDEGLSRRASFCACDDENWSSFPFTHYSSELSTLTRTCSGGSRAGQVCVLFCSVLFSFFTLTCSGGSRAGQVCSSDDVCSGGGKCSDTYNDQKLLSAVQKFGCFFESPVASAASVPKISVCSVTSGNEYQIRTRNVSA